MENPNLMALELVDEAIDFADELNVGVRHLANEAAVLDFEVDRRGGVEAGLLLAEVATGGLATVQTRLGTVGGAPLRHVELTTDHPAESLLACQSTTWSFDVSGATARGSGPATLSREDGHSALDRGEADLGVDEADFAVLVVESDRLPGEDLVETVAAEAGVPTSGVFVLVTPAASVAGGVASAARAGERAVAGLVETGYDPDLIRSVTATAPVGTLADREDEARARSAAAIAYGGRAHLVVEEAVDEPNQLVHGVEPIEDGADLPAPAQVTVDAAGGATYAVGGVDDERLAEALEL